jgi:AraC-like DNA-binding protein
MDDVAKRWMFSKRWFPSPVPVRTIGWLPGKTYWVERRKKPNLTFSFILKGQGELHVADQVLKLKAPCLTIHFPWQESRFGPTGPGGSWDEFYITYYPDTAERFEAMGFLDWEVHTRPLDSAERILSRLNRINDEVRHLPPHHRADWVDRAMEMFLLKVAREEVSHAVGEEGEQLYGLLEWLKTHLDADVNWDELAASRGMSPRSFRRHWKAVFDQSPSAMLKQLRVQEAQHLLEETDYQIQDVAKRVGVEDRLYFSRLFKQETGMSPKAYRDHIRLHHAKEETSPASVIGQRLVDVKKGKKNLRREAGGFS